MRKLIAAFLLIASLIFAGLAYFCYSEYTVSSNVARFYRANPDEVPTGYAREDREHYIASELVAAERNRNLSLLSGAGSLIMLGGAVVLFASSRRVVKSNAATSVGFNQDPSRLEVMDRWASASLASPVNVHYRQLHTIMFVCAVIFFAGISLLMIVVNGFTSTSVLLLTLNGLLIVTLFYILRRARRKAAYVFDTFGVTRGDNQRLNWTELKSVDYRMAIKDGGRKEHLWRVELVFTNGEVWIIPHRVKNLEEINNLVASIPVVHQKRPA